MIPKYTPNQFYTAKSRDDLPLECKLCHRTFFIKKHIIQKILVGQKNITYDFCSTRCSAKAKTTSVKLKCVHCRKSFKRELKEIKKVKNSFCSSSCSATYNNTHKRHGTRRSKLEVWIERKLKLTLPNLVVLYNDKSAISSELDIFIPSLRLGFELNGIYHYEPIHGDKKLEQVQSNDHRKFQACLEQGIELCIIDTSTLKHFKEHNAQKFLDIVVSVIKQKLSTSQPAFAVSS